MGPGLTRFQAALACGRTPDNIGVECAGTIHAIPESARERGLRILDDITPLQRLTGQGLASDVHLFAPPFP